MPYKNTKAMALSRRTGSRLLTNSQLREARNRAVILDADSERNLMGKSELDQRAQKDKFWGVDYENMHKRRNQELMYKENILSTEYERLMLVRRRHQQWEQEYQLEAQQEAYEQAVREMKTRSKYMKALFSATSSDIVYTYAWDTSDLPESQQHAIEIPRQKGDKTDRNGLRNSYHGDPTLTIINPDHIGARSMFHLEGIQQARALSLVPGSVGEDGRRGKEQTLGPLLRGRAATSGIAQDKLISLVRAENDANTNNSVVSRKSEQSNLLSMFGPHPGSLMFSQKPKKVITEEMKRGSQAFAGHPYFKWDQELLLREVFDSLDTIHAGELYPSDVAALSSTPQLQYLLSFTVFGSWVKKKQWSKLLDALFGSGDVSEDVEGAPSASVTDPLSASQIPKTAGLRGNNVSFVSQGGWQDNNTSIAINRWFLAAVALSKESNKPMQAIRTDAEHLSLLTFDNNYHSLEGNSMDYAAMARRQQDKIMRETELITNLSIGDVVWALHNGGCTWMPAVIERINVANLTCDLKFPLSQAQLRATRKKAKGAEIINGKSVTKALQNKLEGNVFLSNGHGAVYPGHYLVEKKMNVINKTLESNEGQDIHTALNTIMSYNSQ